MGEEEATPKKSEGGWNAEAEAEKRIAAERRRKAQGTSQLAASWGHMVERLSPSLPKDWASEHKPTEILDKFLESDAFDQPGAGQGGPGLPPGAFGSRADELEEDEDLSAWRDLVPESTDFDDTPLEGENEALETAKAQREQAMAQAASTAWKHGLRQRAEAAAAELESKAERAAASIKEDEEEMELGDGQDRPKMSLVDKDWAPKQQSAAAAAAAAAAAGAAGAQSRLAAARAEWSARGPLERLLLPDPFTGEETLTNRLVYASILAVVAAPLFAANAAMDMWLQSTTKHAGKVNSEAARRLAARLREASAGSRLPVLSADWTAGELFTAATTHTLRTTFFPILAWAWVYFGAAYLHRRWYHEAVYMRAEARPISPAWNKFKAAVAEQLKPLVEAARARSDKEQSPAVASGEAGEAAGAASVGGEGEEEALDPAILQAVRQELVRRGVTEYRYQTSQMLSAVASASQTGVERMGLLELGQLGRAIAQQGNLAVDANSGTPLLMQLAANGERDFPCWLGPHLTGIVPQGEEERNQPSWRAKPLGSTPLGDWRNTPPMPTATEQLAAEAKGKPHRAAEAAAETKLPRNPAEEAAQSLMPLLGGVAEQSRRDQLDAAYRRMRERDWRPVALAAARTLIASSGPAGKALMASEQEVKMVLELEAAKRAPAEAKAALATYVNRPSWLGSPDPKNVAKRVRTDYVSGGALALLPPPSDRHGHLARAAAVVAAKRARTLNERSPQGKRRKQWQDQHYRREKRSEGETVELPAPGGLWERLTAASLGTVATVAAASWRMPWLRVSPTAPLRAIGPHLRLVAVGVFVGGLACPPMETLRRWQGLEPGDLLPRLPKSWQIDISGGSGAEG